MTQTTTSDTAVTTSTEAVLPLPESLAGTHVLVVGGGTGTGAAAARMLLGLGASVLVATRSGRLPDGVDTAAADGRIRAVAVDMRDEGALSAALGHEKLDHVVVTAADVIAGPVLALTYDQVSATMADWVKGSYQVARVVAPTLSPGGSITFFSGYAGARGLPGWGAGAAAGAGVEALVRVLALELAPLRVNTVRPGATDTAMFRALLGGADDAAVAGFGSTLLVGRIARPEEVAAAALFFMSNPAVTGTVVTVDGGASLI